MKLTLRSARINAQKTVEEVAKELNVTTQTIYNWEQGKTEPKMSLLLQLANIYKVEPNNFKLNMKRETKNEQI